MTYSNEYTSGDLSKMFMDVVGTGALEVINLVGLIVLIALFIVIMKSLSKLGVKLG